jgi:hypothetical protein
VEKVTMKRMARSSGALAAVLIASSIASPQDQPTPRARFSLTFRATSANVLLLCDEGCAWNSLRVGDPRTPVAFDDQGLLSERTERGPAESAFIINVKTVGNRLELRCSSGCRWTALIMEPKFEVHRIDQDGRARTRPQAENRAAVYPAQWKWPAMGSTMRVRIVDGEHIEADNVMTQAPVEVHPNRPRPFAPFGGIESARLSSMGTLYGGYFSFAEVCYYTDGGSDESRNTCRFRTAIEITRLSPERIEGQAESDLRFDCRSCRITGMPRMKPFIWLPVQ